MPQAFARVMLIEMSCFVFEERQTPLIIAAMLGWISTLHHVDRLRGEEYHMIGALKKSKMLNINMT